jgi:dihydroorotase
MKILLKSCKIIDPKSTHNSKVKDILIEGGIVKKISDSISGNFDKIVEVDNLHVSSGWFDAKVNFTDPGNEIKEDIESGLKLLN